MRIVFATDGSHGALDALDFLGGLPVRAEDSIHVVTVSTYNVSAMFDAGVMEHITASMLGHSRDLAEDVAKVLREHGVNTTAIVRGGFIETAILEEARVRGAELIVLGSRGLGSIGGVLLGSTARTLAKQAPLPILVVRGRASPPLRILAAIDGSDDARAALRLLRRMPLPTDASVTLLHVREGPRATMDVATTALAPSVWKAVANLDRRDVDAVFDEAEKLVAPLHVAARVVERGAPARTIVNEARRLGAHLVVLGSRGMTQPRWMLQGSTADGVLAGAHCSVLISSAAMTERERESVPAGAMAAAW